MKRQTVSWRLRGCAGQRELGALPYFGTCYLLYIIGKTVNNYVGNFIDRQAHDIHHRRGGKRLSVNVERKRESKRAVRLDGYRAETALVQLSYGSFKRAGLMWGNLSATQQNAWLQLMQTTLSTVGYNRVISQWNANDVQATRESGPPNDGRPQAFSASSITTSP